MTGASGIGSTEVTPSSRRGRSSGLRALPAVPGGPRAGLAGRPRASKNLIPSVNTFDRRYQSSSRHDAGHAIGKDTRAMYRQALAKLASLLPVRGRVKARGQAALRDGNSRHRQRPGTADGPRSMIDALPDAALLLDGQGVLTAANTTAAGIFGQIFAGEHIGRTARQPELAAAVNSALTSGGKAIFELVIRTPAERHLDGAASRLTGFGDGVNAPAVLIILQDISEREALARMRMEFVANASHELRTPLAAVSGFIETLRGPAKDDAAAREKFLGIMSEQAQRMTRLIDDLLVLSRVEMRAHLVPVTVADLNHVAAEAARLAASLAKKEGAALDLELTGADMKLPGDHDELMQAAQNLVQNALKYGRAGGRVTIRTSRERDRRGGMVVRFSVTDDGPGIAAEHLPRLTERFYRVNTAASRQKGGTGLGLAIVKHIAARHRGRVEVQSTPGQGSTFSLVFPAPEVRAGA
jgi:two-component system, OmpR family, phosphate regulon sensor histidine kinase PhoR